MNCETCGETENVSRFHHFSTATDEWLCWDHRWPFIRERLHGPGATGPPGSVEVPDQPPTPTKTETNSSGQTSLLDF